MKIAIIGGGPAGLFTAIMLGEMKHEVVVLEAGTYSEQCAGEHVGAEALTFMRNLNVPDHVIENNSIVCKGISGAWGQDEILQRSSIFNPYGEGIILSRPQFDQEIATYCRGLNISVETNCRVIRLKETDSSWEIETNTESLIADFVVDASGRNSKFSKAFGTSNIVYDDLIGITKVLKPKQEKLLKESQLLIESTPNGWWYSVELGSGELVLTFMTSAKLLSKSDQNLEMFWQNQINESKHSCDNIADYVVPIKTFTQSAKTQILKNIVGKRWLAVGDAAMSYDPLSSAGILKGIRMGVSAASAINEWASGNTDELNRYEEKCHEIFDEYLITKEAYYALEKRFNDCPFWYNRNIKPKNLTDFSILPDQSLKVLEGNHNEKIEFLVNVLPDVNFHTMLACMRTNVSAQSVLSEYLRSNEERVLNQHHFQAIQSMELMSIISIS